MIRPPERTTVTPPAAANTGANAQPERPPFRGNCPCLSGEQYADCCGRFHAGEAEAPTAEQLMRSRYSAFVVLDAGYLLRTWHPETRPASLELDPDHAVAAAGHHFHRGAAARWTPRGPWSSRPTSGTTANAESTTRRAASGGSTAAGTTLTKLSRAAAVEFG